VLVCDNPLTMIVAIFLCMKHCVCDTHFCAKPHRCASSVAAGSALVQSGCIFFSVGGNKLTKGKIIDMPFLSFF
jgi:hypothetical protein